MPSARPDSDTNQCSQSQENSQLRSQLAAVQGEREQLFAELERTRSQLEQAQQEKEQLAGEVEQLRSQLAETREECEKQILLREDSLAAELTRLRSEVAEAEAQSKIVADNDRLIREVLLPLITPQKEGGLYTPNKATALKNAAAYVLTLLTTEG